ncbi:MAG: type II secretion system protein GspD [Phycisphaerae bacterium]
MLILVSGERTVTRADTVQLDFPDNIELKVVVDYVARTLDLNVLYNEAQLNQRVSLRTATPIERAALLPFLRRLLRARDLILVAEQADNWYSIYPADELAKRAGPVLTELPPADADPNRVITYRLPLQNGSEAEFKSLASSSLSKPGGVIGTAGEPGTVIVSDFLANVRHVVRLADSLTPRESRAHESFERVDIENVNRERLVNAVIELLRQPAAQGLPGTTAPTVRIDADPFGSGVLVRGPATQVSEAASLLRELDRPSQRTTQYYQPRFMTAARLQAVVRARLGAVADDWTQDEVSNTYIVTAEPALHEAIRELLVQFDTARPETATPLRIYQPLHRRADDLFATLASLLGGQFRENPERDQVAEQPSAIPRPVSNVEGGARGVTPVNQFAATQRDNATTGRAAAGGGVAAVSGEGFSLALDAHTNSIIAMATPEIHQRIEQLMSRLDRRRPQVLVEVTLVSISIDDSQSLGVELSTLDLGDPWDFLTFTSFGLSAIDPATGARRLNVLPGGTGVLLAPDEVPFIIQALETHGTTRVNSAPRILVDDNASGSIESVAESPFTSVNASDTVATTSFAGFAKAGTQLQIEPHIAEGDHLELKYDLSVSSFTGAGGLNTPPPRTSDTISSTVRVPDGFTVVVGGLISETFAESRSQVPAIGNVPILGLLFGNRTESKSKVRLYAFIRPTILRDDEFRDLKTLSIAATEDAEVDDGFPPTVFQYMD